MLIHPSEDLSDFVKQGLTNQKPVALASVWRSAYFTAHSPAQSFIYMLPWLLGGTAPEPERDGQPYVENSVRPRCVGLLGGPCGW